jgi:ketosteroid isomerase-like protein
LGKAGRAGLRAAFTGLLALVLLALQACSAPATEEALRATIAGMQAAAQARDAAALAEAISEDFVGPEGMDREQFRRLAAVTWLRDREIGVSLGPLDLALVGSEGARVEFTAATRGGEGWLPDRAQVYRVKTGWRLEDGEWKLLTATWDPSL